ncbi:MAG: multicopper oxidase domain-containing protein [Acidimicrobiia bacterium]
MTEDGVSRRELLKKVGMGGAVLLGGTVLGRVTTDQARATGGDDEYSPGSVDLDNTVVGDDVLGAVYGRGNGIPPGLESDALDAHTFPPEYDNKPDGTVRDVEIVVEERLLEVAGGVYFDAWTYNGTVPAPIIRVTKGDLVRIRFKNRTGHSHNLHFHGAHRPEHDGWEPIPPGAETTYEIEAGPVGLHPYHCHTAPLADHVARGLYGMMIVDPPGGRAPAQEVALLLSGFSNDEIGRNGVVAWNGVAGFYDAHPIKVVKDELVRVYVVNMLEYEPLASFHLHAETFDVYPAGMGETPTFRDDTIALTQGQRAMIEFTLPHYGRYMFHPHQHWLAYSGSMGWFAAI